MLGANKKKAGSYTNGAITIIDKILGKHKWTKKPRELMNEIFFFL